MKTAVTTAAMKRTVVQFVNTKFKQGLYLTGFLLLCAGGAARAQAVQSTNNITDSSAIEEKLVELALKGPDGQRVVHESKIYEYQLRNAKNYWMNLLTISTTYNDQSFVKQSQLYPIVYPKYFFGVNIPLGTLLSRTQVKSAKEGVEIGKLNEEATRRQVRAAVLSKWKQYKAQTELIALETGFMNDLQAALVQAEDKFRKGTITFDAYNVALRNRNDEQARIINLKLNEDLLRIELERMIGTSLDSVLK